MSNNIKVKRTSITTKNPNPLFEQWLKEWHDQAKEKGSDMQFCFAKALTSLKKFPLVLKSGKECAILQNFGKKLCSMIDKKLAEYLQQHPEFDMTKLGPSLSLSEPELISNDKEKNNKNCNKKITSSKNLSKYIPTYRSGAYAILLTLYKKMQEPDYSGYMTKIQLQISAQPFCDVSLQKAEGPNKHYSAWSSMSSLIKKGLVSRSGCPVKFSLTQEGISVAKDLREKNENAIETFHPIETEEDSDSRDSIETVAAITNNNVNDVEDKISLLASDSSYILYQPRSFDIILLVDKQETTGGLRGKVYDQTINGLSELGVMFEVRHLKVGDFAWICRSRKQSSIESQKPELILPYIVERKRMDDFARSIKDGRFHEQKFRLKQCGLKQKIYLIESLGDTTSDERAGLSLSALHQAAANTQLIDEFLVRYTKNHRNSMQYLATFTKVLIDAYKNKLLKSTSKENLAPLNIDRDEINLMPFEEFNKASSKIKNYTIKDMFIKHLLQLNGLSVEKAVSIVNKYPTPQSLRNAYMLHSSPESMLSEIPYGKLGRSIGPVLSKNIYELYMNRHLS